MVVSFKKGNELWGGLESTLLCVQLKMSAHCVAMMCPAAAHLQPPQAGLHGSADLGTIKARLLCGGGGGNRPAREGACHT